MELKKVKQVVKPAQPRKQNTVTEKKKPVITVTETPKSKPKKAVSKKQPFFSEEKKVGKVKHLDRMKDDKRQKWLQYLYDNCGEDCMRTFLAENTTMGITRKSTAVGSNGYSDYGICQINVGYHPYVLSGKGSYGSGKYFKKWFYEPYKQMDKCMELYKKGTKFYAYKHRYQRTKRIIIE